MFTEDTDYPIWMLYVYFFFVFLLSPAVFWVIFSPSVWTIDLDLQKSYKSMIDSRLSVPVPKEGPPGRFPNFRVRPSTGEGDLHRYSPSPLEFSQGFALLLLVNAAAAFPAKLLRVPKIYNALITSKEKILPSEAYPATTGPIFQPIGLVGEPILLHPELVVGRPKPLEVGDGTEVKLPEGANRKSKPPVTFYPRYSLYYAHQPYLTLQQPIIYGQLFEPATRDQHQHMIPMELEVEERKDVSLQHSRMRPKMVTVASAPVEYVKNNSPADRNIPDIPPPPPPVRFRDYEEAR